MAMVVGFVVVLGVKTGFIFAMLVVVVVVGIGGRVVVAMAGAIAVEGSQQRSALRPRAVFLVPQ
jgi:hypothetical protein